MTPPTDRARVRRDDPRADDPRADHPHARYSSSEDGLTLVEMLVVVAILGVVMAAVTGFAINATRTVAGTDQRFADVGQARIGVAAASQYLRTLMPYDTVGTTLLRTEDDPLARDPSPSTVSFYASRDLDLSVDEPPRLIRITVEGSTAAAAGELVVYDTPASWTTVNTADGTERVVSYRAAETVRRVLARGLTDPGVFTFLDATPDDGSDAVDLDDPDTYPALRGVEVRLEVRTQAQRDVTSTVLRQRVRLPNAFTH